MNEFALSCGVTNARSSNTDTRIHDTRIRSLVLLGWWEMERQVMIMGMTEILMLLGLVLFVLFSPVLIHLLIIDAFGG